MDDIKNDKRFSHIASDPRFRLMPKSKRKVRIDARFQSIFSDRRFSYKTDVDKRGRPVLDPSKQNQHVMQRFYELSNDDHAQSESDQEQADLEEEQRKVKGNNKVGTVALAKKRIRIQDEDRNNDVPDRKTQAVAVNNNNNARDKNSETDKISYGSDLAADDGECSSIDSTDEDVEELPEFTQEHVLKETEVDHKWNELQENVPAVVESTHRLAVCNMDWDFVKAQDLFILFRSFIPEGGNIKSVTIYPSEFGKERMAEEAILGPREMRQQSYSDQVDSSVTNKCRKKKHAVVDQQLMKQSKKVMEASNTEKLREYQLNRLRYYFAVVICDSVQTAETVYSECDGREYLLSSVRLDLRFIPDSMTFDDHPKDVFSEENSILEYEPNRFSSTALCQAKVNVTWDETDFDRLSRRLAGLHHNELESIVEENKYADIIAPPESDSDEDAPDQPDWLKQAAEGGTLVSEEEKISLYRRILMDKLEDEGDVRIENVDEEFVWQPGLKSSLMKRMQKKGNKEAETGVVNEYLEKKREKKKKKKDEKMKIVETFHESEISEDSVLDPRNQSKTKNLKRKKKQPVSEDDRMKVGVSEAADLELLVMDGSNDNVKAENKGDVGTSKRRKKSKRKKLSEDQEVVIDVNDARFAALYTSHHFHIDPTAAHFKKSSSMSALVNEQIKRMGQLSAHRSPKLDTQAGSSKSVSLSLIESLRSKMKK